MKKLLLSCAFAASLSASVHARAPDEPVTNDRVTAGDVATTPVSDLNIKKSDIPPLLIAAEQRPYTLTNLGSCQRIAGAIRELDGVLGEDIDLPQTGNSPMNAGRVAQEVVGSFIPFRGIIREVSGANAHQREMREAIAAGIARRSFLKGVGQARGCAYPARAVTPAMFARRMREIESTEQKQESPRQVAEKSKRR